VLLLIKCLANATLLLCTRLYSCTSTVQWVERPSLHSIGSTSIGVSNICTHSAIISSGNTGKDSIKEEVWASQAAKACDSQRCCARVPLEQIRGQAVERHLPVQQIHVLWVQQQTWCGCRTSGSSRSCAAVLSSILVLHAWTFAEASFQNVGLKSDVQAGTVKHSLAVPMGMYAGVKVLPAEQDIRSGQGWQVDFWCRQDSF